MKFLIGMGAFIVLVTLADYATTLYNTPSPPTQSEAIRLLRTELEICLGYSAGYQAGYGTFCKQVGCALGPEEVGETP